MSRSRAECVNTAGTSSAAAGINVRRVNVTTAGYGSSRSSNWGAVVVSGDGGGVGKRGWMDM